MKEPYHPFKFQKAEETYLVHYDEHTKRWPIASEEELVETSFGQTFVRVGGLEDGARSGKKASSILTSHLSKNGR